MVGGGGQQCEIGLIRDQLIVLNYQPVLLLRLSQYRSASRNITWGV